MVKLTKQNKTKQNKIKNPRNQQGEMNKQTQASKRQNK
jgi:hypothetical protein